MEQQRNQDIPLKAFEDVYDDSMIAVPGGTLLIISPYLTLVIHPTTEKKGRERSFFSQSPG